MKILFLLIPPLLCLHLSTGATPLYRFQDSLNVKQIDSIIKAIQYKKAKKNSIDWLNKKRRLWFDKKDRENFVAAISEANTNITFTRYYFIKGKLVKVLYDCNKPDQTRGGGVYYFSEGNLIQKIEKEIEPQNANAFFRKADIIKSEIKKFHE